MSTEMQKKIDELEAKLKEAQTDKEHVPQTTKSWGKNQNSNEKKVRAPRPKTNIAPSKPKVSFTAFPTPGAYLSKTPSALSNDPLATNAYFPSPSEELRPVADRQKVFSGCEVLPAISKETYNQISAKSPNYKKVVPQSAHDYYIAVMTYARLLTLHEQNSGYVSYDEKEFLNSVFVNGAVDGSYPIPFSVSLYLSGLGNTGLPAGRDINFGFDKPDLVISDENQLPGYFGDIDVQMGRYSTYPCLAVYAQRMMQDLQFTGLAPAQRINPAWDLPADMASVDHPINQNCLGYLPAQVIPFSQMECFQNANITPHDFETKNPSIPLNINVLNYVAAKMIAVQNMGYKLATIPTTVHGSVGQLCYEEIAQLLNTRLLSGHFKPSSLLQLLSSAEYLGSSFLYLVYKRNLNERILRRILPITYANHEVLPPEVPELMSSSIDQTDQSLFNCRFEAIRFDPEIRIERIVSQDV